MRITILRALGLGDLLTAVPALRAVRAAHPHARLELATAGALAPLVELVGAVDAVVTTGPFVATPPAGRLPDRLHRADLALNLHGAGPQSTELLRAAEPSRLVSYGVTSAWRAEEHDVRRWCRLLEEAGIPADPTDLALRRPPVASPAPGAVVIHPGAAYGARRWPAQRWAAVARDLASAGHPVVISGGPDELRLAGAVAREAGLGDDAVLAGRTSLVTLAALVAEAALVACGDTGVAHLATAYGVRSVTLFGPTPPALWGPPPRPQHQVLWAGRTGDPLGDQPAAGLLELPAAEVLAAAAQLLGTRC